MDGLNGGVPDPNIHNEGHGQVDASEIWNDDALLQAYESAVSGFKSRTDSVDQPPRRSRAATSQSPDSNAAQERLSAHKTDQPAPTHIGAYGGAAEAGAVYRESHGEAANYSYPPTDGTPVVWDSHTGYATPVSLNASASGSAGTHPSLHAAHYGGTAPHAHPPSGPPHHSPHRHHYHHQQQYHQHLPRQYHTAGAWPGAPAPPPDPYGSGPPPPPGAWPPPPPPPPSAVPPGGIGPEGEPRGYWAYGPPPPGPDVPSLHPHGYVQQQQQHWQGQEAHSQRRGNSHVKLDGASPSTAHAQAQAQMRARSTAMAAKTATADALHTASSPPSPLIAAAMAGEMPPRSDGEGDSSVEDRAGGFMPSGQDGFKVLQDPELANLLMAWYYSGYYTGRYQAQREAREAAAGVHPDEGARAGDVGSPSSGTNAGADASTGVHSHSTP